MEKIKKTISLSIRPWYEMYTNKLPNAIWEKPIKKCGFDIFKIAKKDVEEFIALNPNMTQFGHGLDSWFNSENIGTQEFFELLKYKQIYYRRIVEYSNAQKQWLKDKYAGKICVFNEMHPMDEEVFNELGITYINFFMPPIRFTKISKIQSVCSNDPKIEKTLKKYSYPTFLYRIFANWLYLTHLSDIKALNKQINIPENSCLIVGQCRFDYSKYNFETKSFVQLSDYAQELKELTKNYSKVYYTKHPHEKEIYDKKLLESLGIEIIEGFNTYSLMLSKNVKGVCALSSSMLTESRFFDKVEHRLFTNFVDMENKFINITRRNIRKKSFWAKVLNQ